MVEVTENLQVSDLLLLVLPGVEALLLHCLRALNPQMVEGLNDEILEADNVPLIPLCSLDFPAQFVVGLDLNIAGQVF